jgi:hypothetical protein
MADVSMNVMVGLVGDVAIADYSDSLALPTNESTALDAAYDDIGFVTDDGATVNASADKTDIMAWQSDYPVRSINQSRSFEVAFSCLEFNTTTIALAFGGGEVKVTSGKAVYTPPKTGTLTYKSLVLEWEDEGYKTRLVVPRGTVSSDVSAGINKQGAITLPITFTANPADSVTDAYKIYSNHPALTGVVGS